MLSKPSAVTLGTLSVLVLTGIYFVPQSGGNSSVALLGAVAATGEVNEPQPKFTLIRKANANADPKEDTSKSGEAALVLNYFDMKAGFKISVAKDSLKPPAQEKGILVLLVDGVKLLSIEVPKTDLEGAENYEWDAVDLSLLANQGKKKLSLSWTPDVTANDTEMTYFSETELAIKIDAIGPMLGSVRLTGQPEAGLALVLSFQEDDLNSVEAIKDSNYEVKAMDADGNLTGSDLAASGRVFYDGSNVVRLFLGRINVGSYKLTVKSNLTDEVGNKAGGGAGADQFRIFSSEPSPETGPRIEFPEYLPSIKEPYPADRKPNPGDRVQTRVARLYYFRDAHRVAQIINRTTKSYNRAAVTQAQRRAEDARTRANKLTDQRRAKERAAITAAQETRRLERKRQESLQELNQLQTQLAQASQPPKVDGTIETGALSNANVHEAFIVGVDISDISVSEVTLGPNTTAADLVDKKISTGSIKGQGTIKSGIVKGNLKSLEDDVVGTITSGNVSDGTITAGNITDGKIMSVAGEYNDGDHSITRVTLGGVRLNGAEIQLGMIVGARGVRAPSDTSDLTTKITNKQTEINQLQPQINAARTRELQLDEASKVAQASEDRAIEERFRLEVAAAHEDPDTFAPAKKDTVDPVAQVSISVIGEGLLHLRGPIRGINTIRRMIDQIDSPVGQIRIGINTVQINGEKGDRMERVAGCIEGQIDLARFLTAQSLMMLRKAVEIEAAQIAQMSEQEGHYQVDRDRKYLYQFFGRDFIDELYEMDSEFLRTENKLLSLHSMDTISLNRALFIMALAKNDVRQRILSRFMAMVRTQLPQAEWDFRRASELYPHKTRRFLPFTDRKHIEEHTAQRVFRNAQQRYHFRSLRGFFGDGALGMDGATVECPVDDSGEAGGLAMMGSDTMNSTQRTFLRLAQIFKSQMIAEEEVKQRIIERAIIEDEREESFKQEQDQREQLRAMALRESLAAQKAQFQAQRDVTDAVTEMEEAFLKIQSQVKSYTLEARQLEKETKEELDTLLKPGMKLTREQVAAKIERVLTLLQSLQDIARQPVTESSIQATNEAQKAINEAQKAINEARKRLDLAVEQPQQLSFARIAVITAFDNVFEAAIQAAEARGGDWKLMRELLYKFADVAQARPLNWNQAVVTYQSFKRVAESVLPEPQRHLLDVADKAWTSTRALHRQTVRAKLAREDVERTRAPLDHKKLLDFLIDEREEKYIELREGTRSYISAVDNYLKRLATALEDDFKVQFYDPAFVRVRQIARAESVTLGQIERTTILMNNRALAIVRPSATMEFDLPKRDVVIVEALNGAKALAQDYGALLNDPTFLAAFQLMGGGKQPGVVKDLYPGLGTQTDETIMGLNPSQPAKSPSALQALVPDPAIYKFETGTAFEIRPVIQPDGDSIVYDFNYMYTTNVREPVRADEKHLGRIKRHFIDTQVQTSSFEMREVSRYQVALKVARTTRGVPLFEDIPGLGVLFRPAPSAESSLQQNIILAKSTVYPTLFDLMGLRWARQVVDLDHVGLRDSEHIVRGRNQTVEDFVFDRASSQVDEFLDIKREYPQHYRPDLYHQQRQPSPYHPRGYIYRREHMEDPTGEDFRIRDRRPPEMRQPPYEDRFRRPYEVESIELDGLPSGTTHGQLDTIDPLLPQSDGTRRLSPDDIKLNFQAPPSEKDHPSSVVPATYQRRLSGPTRNRRPPRRLPSVPAARR